MEILNAEQLNEKLVDLINESREIYFMAAWATDSSRAFEALKKNRYKIKKAVIGTHFYQTSPKFIKEFLNNNQIRYIKLPSGVFHPKVYLFICGDDDVQVIIGSSNFTHGGLSSNYELSILTNRKKDGVVVDRLFKEIGKKFSEAERYSADQLEEYELKWKHNKPIRARLAVSQNVSTIDDTHHYIDVDIQNLTWGEYVTLVESDEIHSLKGRVRVLKESRKLFKKGFDNISDFDRRCIEGLEKCFVGGDKDSDWMWFGKMTRASRFYKNWRGIKSALDFIPMDGDVSEKQFNNYLNAFRRASSSKDPIGSATRLLCMKRPDVFVCIDNPNNANISSAYKMGAKINCKKYWELIHKIKSSKWWIEAPVDDELYPYRVALLDAVFYEPEE